MSFLEEQERVVVLFGFVFCFFFPPQATKIHSYRNAAIIKV